MSGGCLVGCAADVVPGRSAAVNPRRAAQSGWRAAARPRILRRCSPIRSPRCSPASFATSVSRSATPIFRSRPSCRVFGALLVDEERLLYPGDVLHEAGHIPVASPQERSRETLKPRGGGEIAAIAWPTRRRGSSRSTRQSSSTKPATAARLRPSSRIRGRALRRHAAPAVVRHDSRAAPRPGAGCRALPLHAQWLR